LSSGLMSDSGLSLLHCALSGVQLRPASPRHASGADPSNSAAAASVENTKPIPRTRPHRIFIGFSFLNRTSTPTTKTILLLQGAWRTQTGTAIGITATVLEDLDDVNYGDWEWLTHDEVRAGWPALFELWFSAPHWCVSRTVSRCRMWSCERQMCCAWYVNVMPARPWRWSGTVSARPTPRTEIVIRLPSIWGGLVRRVPEPKRRPPDNSHL